MLMPGEILAGLAGSLLPIAGAGLSAHVQRRWALQDRDYANEYNTPANQLARLKAAGLPAAAFFSGGVSSQSEMPSNTNVDPTLGVAEGLQNYFQNRIQKAQIKAVEADARGKAADADIKEIDAAHAKEVLPHFTGVTGGPVNRQQFKRNQEQELLNSEVELKHQTAAIQGRIRMWQERYGDQLNDQQLRELGANIARTELHIENEKLARQFTNDFIEAYSSGNLGKAFGALIGKYLQSKSN